MAQKKQKRFTVHMEHDAQPSEFVLSVGVRADSRAEARKLALKGASFGQTNFRLTAEELAKGN